MNKLEGKIRETSPLGALILCIGAAVVADYAMEELRYKRSLWNYDNFLMGAAFGIALTTLCLVLLCSVS